MKNILVPLDGSNASIKAATQAIELARVFSSNVTLLCVVEVSNNLTYLGSGDPYSAEYFTLSETMVKFETERMGKMLDNIAEKLDTSGLNVEKKLVVGSAHPQILEIAESGKFDLIVMGHRGMNPVKRLFVGSVARRVIADAPCSVLIVK